MFDNDDQDYELVSEDAYTPPIQWELQLLADPRERLVWCDDCRWLAFVTVWANGACFCSECSQPLPR